MHAKGCICFGKRRILKRKQRKNTKKIIEQRVSVESGRIK
jgi:hypothetical protein